MQSSVPSQLIARSATARRVISNPSYVTFFHLTTSQSRNFCSSSPVGPNFPSFLNRPPPVNCSPIWHARHKVPGKTCHGTDMVDSSPTSSPYSWSYELCSLSKRGKLPRILANWNSIPKNLPAVQFCANLCNSSSNIDCYLHQNRDEASSSN